MVPCSLTEFGKLLFLLHGFTELSKMETDVSCGLYSVQEHVWTSSVFSSFACFLFPMGHADVFQHLALHFSARAL